MATNKQVLDEVRRRKALLDAPSAAAWKKLMAFREGQNRELILPDPCGGGLLAPIMILSISPSWDETFHGMASGLFVHDGFAEAVEQSGLREEDIFFWSVVPWSVHNRFILTPDNKQTQEGVRMFHALANLMPNLRQVILLGQATWVLEGALSEGTRPAIHYSRTWSSDKRTKLNESKLSNVESVLKAVNMLTVKRPQPSAKADKEEVRRDYTYA